MLTPSQQTALEDFINFLASPEKYFLIFGSAGTGKTHLLKELLQSSTFEKANQLRGILGLKPIETFELTATTNKAVAVLHNLSYSCTDPKTLASYLKIRPDGQGGWIKWDVTEPRDLVFVDECSYITDFQMQLLKKQDTKVVFIGDPYQLTLPGCHIDWSLFNNKAVLTEQVRTSHKDILKACNHLRGIIDNPKGGILLRAGPHITNLGEDDDAMRNLLSTSFGSSATCDTRVIAYTNSLCSQYTDYIYKLVGKPPLLSEGNIIISPYYYRSNDDARPDFVIPADAEIGLIQRRSRESYLIGDRPAKRLYYERWLCQIGTTKKVLRLSTVPNQHTILKRSLQKYDWPKLELFIDPRSPWVSTIHKAQGSTYDQVIIDLDSFNSCPSISLAARLLYVGISRARNQVFLYGKLPAHLGRILNEVKESI